MDYSIKEDNMGLLSDFQRTLMKSPQLTFLFLEITDSCNLRCQHCGSDCSSKRQTYLSYPIIEDLLRKVSEQYDSTKIMICITGGEPLIHPDVEKIIKTSSDFGFKVGITTNGTLVTENVAKSLVSAGLNTVAVSLDGFGKTHDEFRKIKGSFRRAIEGIHNFRAAGIDPQAVTVVHKKNIQELDKLYSFLVDDKFESWGITTIEPIGRAKENIDLLLGKSELRIVFDFIKEKRFDLNCEMEVTYGCSHFVTMKYEREIRDFYFQCGAGTKVAGIRANGNIVACLDIEDCDETIQGNIYRDDFVNIWNTKYDLFREDRSDKNEKCRNCKNKKVCMGDAAHTWDFKNNEPQYCISNLMED